MGREQRIIDLIDNESFLKKTSMTLKMSGKAKAEQAKRVESNADWLVKVFSCPESRPFYCKCALHIRWSRVVEMVELALRPRVKNHAAYFGRLATTEMMNLGVA